MVDRRITVDVTMNEFVDGRLVNSTTLRREGIGSHLTVAERVMAALEVLASVTDATEYSARRADG